MKIAFVIPVLDEVNFERTFRKINDACSIDFDVYFAINGKLNAQFKQLRDTFSHESKVKAFIVDKPVNEHKLITLGMEMTGDYDATIIYSGKEEPNADVIKAFINSWKAGNKIVYLKKEYFGFKKVWINLKRAMYKMFIKSMGIFKDCCAETDIQLLDKDVVKTINQLPQKNRQLRILDSFVGYPTDIIQLEIDSKMKENKNYDEKSKAYKSYGAVAVISMLLCFSLISLGVVGISLSCELPPLLYICFFVVGVFLFILSLLFATRRTLAFRIGSIVEVSEINDLRSKIEKYNISNKK